MTSLECGKVDVPQLRGTGCPLTRGWLTFPLPASRHTYSEARGVGRIPNDPGPRAGWRAANCRVDGDHARLFGRT